MRRSLRQRRGVRTSLRRKGEDGSSEESSSDSEALETEKAKADSARKSNVVRRRRRSSRVKQSLDDLYENEENKSQETTVGSHFLPNNTDVEENVSKGNVVRRRSLRARQSLGDSYGNEENRSQETTVGSHFLPNNTDVDENVLNGNVVSRRRSLRARQSLGDSYGNEENRSQETTVGSHFLPNNTDVDENMLKGNVVRRRRSLRVRQSLDNLYGNEENRSQETPVGSHFLPNNTDVDENVLKGLRPGWWRDLQDSHSTNAVHLSPSPILGDTGYDFSENRPQGWYHHLNLTEIPSFRRTSDTMTRSSGMESYPSPDTASSPKLHKQPFKQKIAVINAGDFQDAYDLEDSKHHSSTRSKSLQTSSRNSRSISQEHESLSEKNKNTHENNLTKTKNSNIVHSSIFSDTEESPVRRKRPLRRDSKFPSDYQELDAVLEGSDIEIQDAVRSTTEAQIHSVNVSNNVEDHPVFRHDGLTESGQSSSSSSRNTNLKMGGHRPFAHKRKRKSSLYKNLNLALEDDVESPQGDEIHTKSNSVHSSPLSESTNSPVKNSSKPLRKKRSVKLSNSEDFTKTYEDDTELVQVKDRYKTINGIVPLSDGIDDNQKERRDKSELEGDQVSNQDHDISYNKISRKSIGSSILLHSTESPVLPNLRPFRKRFRTLRDYQHFEEALEDNEHSVIHRDKSGRLGHDELLLKRVASYEGNSDQISGTSKDLQSIEEKSPTTTGDVSPIGKMGYNLFARKKSRKSSVYGDLELVLEENSESSQTPAVPSKNTSVPSGIPSESSQSPSKRISGSPTKTASKIFQKNKSVILLNERDLATAFEDNSSDTIDRNKSKRVSSVDGDDNVASSTNHRLFEKSVHSNSPSDTTGSPVRTNIRPFKNNSKIITDYQHFEEALDNSDTRTSDKNKSRKSQGSTGGGPSTSGSSRDVAMVVEQGSSYDIQSPVSNTPPTGRMSIKPLMGKKGQTSSIYQGLEMALQEKITTDNQHSDETLNISDSRTSGGNKSRKSQGSTGGGPSTSGSSREAAMLVSYEIQSSVSNASPSGKKSIKPLVGRKSQKSSVYKDLELAVQEKSTSKITTDDNDDSKASRRNKSRKSHGITDAGPSDTSREAGILVEQDSFKEDSYEIQSSVSNTSPAGKKSIKPLMGRKRQKSSIYKDLELAVQEKSTSQMTTDDNDDSKASRRNKSRKSHGITDAGPSDTSREAGIFVEQDSFKEDSYEIQSSGSNTSPAGKKSIKPLMGRKRQKSSIYKDLELAVQEKSTSQMTTDDNDDSKASRRNKSRKSHGITDAGPSDTSREAGIFVEQDSFKEDSYEIQSSGSNTSPAGKKSIKPLMGRKRQKSSIYKDLELAVQEKSTSKMTTDDNDDSKASRKNKSRKSHGTTDAGPSGTSSEAGILVEQDLKEDSYEIQSSVSNTSPAGKKSIKPLMGRKRQKSSIYKDLELAVQEKSTSKMTTDDNDDSKASRRNKSRKSHGTTDAGPSGTSSEAGILVEQDLKEDSYEIQSSVSNTSPAGKKSIKPLMGRKRQKSSIYKDLELAVQEKSTSKTTTDDNDDSKASRRNKSRKSHGTTDAGPSGTSREAGILVEQGSFKEDSYEIQSSVSNTSPAGKKSIKPLMGRKRQKSSIYKDLELALQEKSVSTITTDYHNSGDNDDSRASGGNKSKKSQETSAGPSISGTSREAAMLVEQDSFKEVSYDIQSSVTNASRAGKRNIKSLMGKKRRKSSIYKDLELALQEKSASNISTDDDDDSKASRRNKSRKSRGTAGAGPSASGTSREAAIFVEQDSFKEDSYEIQSSVSNTSPAGKKSIKPLMRKKSRKSSYKNLEVALQEESSSESGETPRNSSSVHSHFSSESSKSSVRNVSHIFPKNKSVVLSGLSTAFEGVSQSSNAAEGTKSNKEESESFHSNIREKSRNSADLHKNQTASEKSVSSNTLSNTTESPLQTILTPFQKNTKLASGYQDLNEGLEDSDSSMFDRGKITMSKTGTQLEHHEHTLNITPEYSVRASSPKEMAGEKEPSPTSLSDTSPMGKMRHRPFSRKKIRKSSIYGGLQLVLDEKAEYSHKSEVHRIGTSTGSSLPSETSGSPIKTASKPSQKNKSVLPSYEADFEAISEDDSSSSDISDNNRSKKVRSVDGNDIESSRDRLYNRQLGNRVVSQQTMDMPMKNSQQNVVSSMNRALFDKYVQSDTHSDTTGSPDRTNIRVLGKNSKVKTDHHFEDLDSSNSSLSGRKVSRKSRWITVETEGTISTEPIYIEEPVTSMSREAAMLVVQDSLTRQKEVSYDIQSSPARKMNTEPLMQRKRSVTFKGIDGQEDILSTSNIQELLTVSSHKEGADEIQTSSSLLNHNSSVGKMTLQPFTQKVRKSSVYQGLELVLEQNTLPSQTDEILKEATAVPSGLPSESSGSPTKTVSKISEKNKSIILSKEGDLAGAFEDGSYADSDDIEPPQNGQHNSQLSGDNRNVFSKQSEQTNANNSRYSGTSSTNHSVSDSLVQSNIPSDNTGSPVTDNQHFEGILDSGDSSTIARNKSRKSDQVQQESVRQKEMLNIQPSVSNATPARNIPLMQNNSQKSSVSKSLKFDVEENTVVSQTSKLHRKSTSGQSNLSAQYSESPGKKFSKHFHNKESVVINEADFAAALDEDLDSSDNTVEKTSVHDIELSQDKQHSSHLRIMNKNSMYLNQDNTDIQHGHEVSVSSDDTVKLSDENTPPHRKNVEGSLSNRENSNKNTIESKMPSRSQVLVKPSEELEMSFSSNSEPVPVANSTAVIHSPAKKMKYTAATISDAGGSSTLVERSSHIPSPKQRSFLQNNEISETFPSMRHDKSHKQSETNMKSPRVVNVQQQLPQGSSARKIGNKMDLHHSSGLVATENDHGNKDIVGNGNSFNKSKDQFEPSPVVTTNIKKSISRFRLSNEKRNEAGKPPIKRTSGSLLSKSVIFSEGTNKDDKNNLLSLAEKRHTNNVSGLSRSLQKNQDLEKAKERNRERMTEIEENLGKEKKKPRTIQEYFEAMKIANSQKPTKPPISKPKDPDFLVNGKVYHPPPFKKPKAWVSKPLINTILKHCEKKYGPMIKRRKAEEFLSTLCDHVSHAMRRSKNYSTSVENTKKVLYEFGVIKTLHDFYCFIEDNLPTEFRIKAIPCIRAFGQTTGPPWIPGTNIFQELEFD